MTDRELLELAAKAAGIEGSWWGQDFCYAYNGNLNIPVPWRPLTDDGDALRLAVKLGLEIQIRRQDTEVWVCPAREDEPLVREQFNRDEYAATRRAIVRAASQAAEERKS
ncbi:hypothetical protein [Pandoraea sp. SD6-2]|uniref:hypothetical protein n=1 Tax=Pandoraea sp. SD6-2 TaxID=1286093 RepID=UPI00032DFC5A|nr:hypothetical protein [Pandoraea sp. SD6-2]EON13113.1 hypothetical protein C266_13914 [Pandoraea sp. SD6-2]